MPQTRRVAAGLATLAMVAAPATAAQAASHSHSGRKAAEKYCRALLKKDGKAKFDKTYGPRNAFGKCVASYEKTHPTKGKKH